MDFNDFNKQTNFYNNDKFLNYIIIMENLIN